jgi:hypothetical protein
MIRNLFVRPIAIGFGSLALVAVGTGTATADAPVPFSSPPQTVTVTSLCAFPVTVTYTLEGIVKDDIDPETGTGTLTAHSTETDTFTANGVTLQGTPFQVSYRLTLVNGESTVDVSTGVGVRVPLPNGKTFKSAGLIDYRTGGAVGQPTHGGTQNLDAFCAALS